MKPDLSIFTITLFIGLTNCYADTCQYHFGSVNCGSVTVSSIKANGIVVLNGTTIINQLSINGKLTATNANINKISSNGTCTLNKSVILGNAVISGLLTAVNSQFYQPITLNSNSSTLNASSTGDIAVIIPLNSGPSSLCLENNTHTGSIAFSQGTGIVYESGGSTALNVINGKIVQGDCP